MNLQPITLQVDKKNKSFASDDSQTLLGMYEEYYPKTGYNPPWTGYFVIRENQVVGSCSFTGKPHDGKVEIAYWTFKDFEGQGIASFACRELIAIAKKTDPGVIITAKTAPRQNASTKILENNNFVFKEVVQDDEIGDAWLWVHQN